MNEIIAHKRDVLDLVRGNVGSGVVPKPFERDIFLWHTRVAGTGYVPDIKPIVTALKIDDVLDLFREPDNRFDERAIVVRTHEGAKLGYVPRRENAVFSRLMDAGKYLFAKVRQVQLWPEYPEEWPSVEMEIYLRD